MFENIFKQVFSQSDETNYLIVNLTEFFNLDLFGTLASKLYFNEENKLFGLKHKIY